MSEQSRGIRLARRLRRQRDERGAYAILFSMMLVLVIALAAIAVDIASQVDSKQRLKDTMDAAAHEGALKLDSGPVAAIAAAQDAAKRNGYDGALEGTTWCVVAAVKVSGVNQPLAAQLPGTCDPGLGLPWTKAKYSATVCSDALCFIPCDKVKGKCNTMRLKGEREVDYAFAPAIGYDKGSTGAVVTVACKGSCGTSAPNPLDIVVVADRTPSMGEFLPDLRGSIRSMLTVMDPSMHFVALGTIDAAATKPTSSTLLANTACPTGSTANHKARVDPGKSPSVSDMKKGWWMATQFSNTYSTPAGESFVVNDRDRVSNAVKCLDFSTGSGGSWYATHLAAPLRSAVQHLHHDTASNLKTLSTAAKRPGVVRKVVIFETDGAPVERQSNPGNLTMSTVDSEMGTFEPRHTNAATACTNLKNVADAAKDKGTLIITVGFGNAATGNCGSEKISTVLADVATDSTTTGCDTADKRKTENEDGDYFFCATTGAELAPIFTTAFGQLSTGVKFLKMPA